MPNLPRHDVRDEQSTEQEQSIEQGTPVQTHRRIEEHQDHNNNAFLQEPAVSEEYWNHINAFYEHLDQITREECVICNEKWFDMKIKDGVCERCRRREIAKRPHLFTIENNADVGSIPEHLPELTQIEEQLIARVHVHLQVWQVKGQQYKYKSHIVNFMQNTPKVYNKLPLLPTDLNISCSKPFEYSTNAKSNRPYYLNLPLGPYVRTEQSNNDLQEISVFGE